MIRMRKSLVVLALIAAVGTAIFERNQYAVHTRAARAEEQQIDQLLKQIQALQQELDSAANTIAALQKAQSRLQSDAADVFTLRSEISQIRSEGRNRAPLNQGPSEGQTNVTTVALSSWLRRTEQFKRLQQVMPEKVIPEMKLLTENDWLEMAKESFEEAGGKEVNTEDDSTARRILRSARGKAKEKFGSMLIRALRGYTEAHNDDLPLDAVDLTPYFGSPPEESLLRRYEVLQSGKFENVPVDDVRILVEKAPVDPEFDTRLVIGKHWLSAYQDWK